MCPASLSRRREKVVTIEGLTQAPHPVQKHGSQTSAPVWVLPIWHDHGRGSATQEKSQTNRRRNRRKDHQYLPLWNLYAHSRSDPRSNTKRLALKEEKHEIC